MAMLEYMVGVTPLVQHLQEAFPDVYQPCYQYDSVRVKRFTHTTVLPWKRNIH